MREEEWAERLAETGEINRMEKERMDRVIREWVKQEVNRGAKREAIKMMFKGIKESEWMEVMSGKISGDAKIEKTSDGYQLKLKSSNN